jgi:hypothetical protein
VPRGPFRVNTTGLRTEGLPPPPTRIVQRSDTPPTSPPKPPRHSSETSADPPAIPRRGAAASGAPPAKKPNPSLPPPLPPREDTTFTTQPAAAASPITQVADGIVPAAYGSELQPGLHSGGRKSTRGAVGGKVHGLNIGAQSSAGNSTTGVTQDKPSLSGHVAGRDANVSELQAKFAKIRATEREHEINSGAAAPTPTRGTRPVEAPPPVPLGTKPR